MAATISFLCVHAADKRSRLKEEIFASVEVETDETYSRCKSHCAVLNETASFWLVLPSVSVKLKGGSPERTATEVKASALWINPNHSYVTLESEVPGFSALWNCHPAWQCSAGSVPSLPGGFQQHWDTWSGTYAVPMAVAVPGIVSTESLCPTGDGSADLMLLQNVHSFVQIGTLCLFWLLFVEACFPDLPTNILKDRQTDEQSASFLCVPQGKQWRILL